VTPSFQAKLFGALNAPKRRKGAWVNEFGKMVEMK